MNEYICFACKKFYKESDGKIEGGFFICKECLDNEENMTYQITLKGLIFMHMKDDSETEKLYQAIEDFALKCCDGKIPAVVFRNGGQFIGLEELKKE